MAKDMVDFSRSIYTVSGSNLAFESMDMVEEYLIKKWGLQEDQIKSIASSVGEFQSGADVQTLRLNDKEAKILCRRVVTKDNVDATVKAGW